jgi:hypothetical protein
LFRCALPMWVFYRDACPSISLQSSGIDQNGLLHFFLRLWFRLWILLEKVYPLEIILISCNIGKHFPDFEQEVWVPYFIKRSWDV